MRESPITTHVLDIARGQPAKGVRVTLEAELDGEYKVVAQGETDNDGRVMNLVAEEQVAAGVYRLTFHTRDYQLAQSSQSFYPQVNIVFEVSDSAQHYHVPLLLSQYGYSTYRGS